MYRKTVYMSLVIKSKPDREIDQYVDLLRTEAPTTPSRSILYHTCYFLSSHKKVIAFFL